MAYFYQPPMPPVPPGATPEKRRALFEAYVGQVRQANPHLNTRRGFWGWLTHLFGK